MTSDQEATVARLNVYASLMEEIKYRHRALNLAAANKIEGLGPLLCEEFCYLQLRMICELLALGCLVAHDDIPAVGSKIL
ncbi:MAG: hypothetical protein AB7J28_04280, partial [Hyphomonadaceae bacterium]